MDNIFIFKGLKDTEKNIILNAFCNEKIYKKGEIIYSAENFQNSIGIIKSGKAVAINESVILNTFNENDAFGIAAVFCDDTSYVSTIIAKEDCKVLYIEKENLNKIFEQFPTVSINYIYYLSNKVRHLNKKINLISANTAEETVLKYLNTTKNDDGISTVNMNMTSFAKLLGLSRATLYRAIDNLESQGKIERKTNEFKVI